MNSKNSKGKSVGFIISAVAVTAFTAILTVWAIRGMGVGETDLGEESTAETQTSMETSGFSQKVTVAATTSAVTTTASAPPATTTATTTTTTTTTTTAATTVAETLIITTAAGTVDTTIIATLPPETQPPLISSGEASEKPKTSRAIKGVMGGEIEYVPEVWIYKTGDAISAEEIDKSRNEMLELINAKRLELGLGELVLSNGISQVAQARALECVSVDDILHKRPDGTHWESILDEWNYTQLVDWHGENLGYTSGVKVNGITVTDLWMRSPTHYENIIKSEYTHIGIGIAAGVNNNIYYSNIFVQALEGVTLD